MISIRALLIVFFVVESVQAVTIDMVPVGNPGNAPDTRYNSISVGSVPNAYQIGKYEITAGQYTEFLNAVAKADPNGLYNTAMGDTVYPSVGANIQRSGSSPNYSYSVAADWATRPVNWVSFWDAARFVNWLHNGQPTGSQGPGTTEGGAYHEVGNQTLFGRNAGAKFFIPTENEWYKAAYHDKTAGLAASYFNYPTGTNAVPGNKINETSNPGNNANFYLSNFAIGSPYYRTVAGEFELSDSPYGTFDQGGNVSEWDETVIVSSSRGLRGGSYSFSSNDLQASYRDYNSPTSERVSVGFRVASIPGQGVVGGDYNHDGVIDAGDYVVWRKSDGIQAEYRNWRAHFGNPVGGGTEFGNNMAVPEPAAIVLLAIVGCALVATRYRKAVHHKRV